MNFTRAAARLRLTQPTLSRQIQDLETELGTAPLPRNTAGAAAPSPKGLNDAWKACGGPPPHVHANEDESFYVLEGELELWVAGKMQRLRAGDFAFGPRNVPHRFHNATSRPVRVLVQLFPGSSGRFFAEVACPLPSDGGSIPPPTEEEIRHLLATAPRHGITILPPT